MELTDLELEEKVADIKGTAQHNVLAGGRSFPSYLEWRLLGPLMIENDIDLIAPYRKNGDTKWEAQMFIEKFSDVSQAYDENPCRAILLCFIEAHKEQSL